MTAQRHELRRTSVSNYDLSHWISVSPAPQFLHTGPGEARFVQKTGALRVRVAEPPDALCPVETATSWPSSRNDAHVSHPASSIPFGSFAH